MEPVAVSAAPRVSSELGMWEGYSNRMGLPLCGWPAALQALDSRVGSFPLPTPTSPGVYEPRGGGAWPTGAHGQEGSAHGSKIPMGPAGPPGLGGEGKSGGAPSTPASTLQTRRALSSCLL